MEWMTAVRDHPDRPPAMQRHVLLCLALRMDWRSGTGWASALQLAADAGVSEHTARRATVWGRRPCSCGGAECAEHGLLHRTSRGHRRGDGTAAASGWELALPPQPATDGRLRPSQPASGAVSTGQWPASLPATGHRPSRPGPSRPGPSAARELAAATIRLAYPDATDDEIGIIITERESSGARSVGAVLTHELTQRTLRLPCDRDGPASHTAACRSGTSPSCSMDWCACRCHIKPAAAP